MIAASPDAVFIFSAGTPGALPHVELVKRGYKGRIYQTQGVANADFLRVGGKDLDGSLMTVAPVLVVEQLPDSNPVKKPGLDYVKRYEDKYGAGSRSLFGATAWDAQLWLNAAIPIALKKGKPGTPEFRTALRDAIENLKEFVGSQARLQPQRQGPQRRRPAQPGAGPDRERASGSWCARGARSPRRR